MSSHTLGKDAPRAGLIPGPLTRWGFAGLGIVACLVGVSLLSARFEYGGDRLARPIPLVVGLMLVAGVCYLGAVVDARRVPVCAAALAWAVAVGLVLRAVFWVSTPICETDFYRYLWDGAVTAHGYNPFVHTPLEVADGEEDVPDALAALAIESGPIIDRVNHAELGTIYPPVAQAAFALAHWLGAWRLGAWRAVLLLFDAVALGLVFLILRRLGQSPLYMIVYWWNPLLIKETYNSLHMDVVILPFVLGALLLSLSSRPAGAGGLLALAAGAKLWPVTLLPLLLRRAWPSRGRILALLGTFAAVAACLAVFVLPAVKLGEDSGFVAYGRTWEMNDALYMAVEWPIKTLADGLTRDGQRLIGRGIAAAALAAIVLGLAWRAPYDDREFCRRAMLVVAAVFLLSPTQFPWYFVWLAPFLAFSRRPSLLLLTALLPLYYLRFYFKARDNTNVFDHGIVWLEFVPVWGLFVAEFVRGWLRGRTQPRLEVH